MPPPVRHGEVALRIMQTTDLHGRVMPYDYTNCEAQASGLAALGAVIDQLRADHPGALTFDCGDAFQGAPMGDVYGQNRVLPAPIVAAMNAVGYDAMALGNHDFSFGEAYLAQALDGADFPVVASNWRSPAITCAPWVMIDRVLPKQGGGEAALRIAVLGVLPLSTPQWERANLAAPLEVTPMVAAVRTHADAARAAGADLVIVLAHTGYATTPEPDPDSQAREIAALAQVDVVLAGHTHELHPSAGCVQHLATGETPCIMAGAYGRYVGVLDLVLAPTAEGGWSIRCGAARNAPAGQQALEMPACVQTAHTDLITRLDEPVAKLPDRLHSYFGLLGHDSVGRLIAAAMIRAARRLAPVGSLPVIAMTPPFQYGFGDPRAFVDLSAGQLRRRHLDAIYPYPNRLSILRASPDVVRRWLEQAVSGYAQITPGQQDVALLGGAGYALDAAYGLRYEIDLAHPPGQRVGAITHQGQPIEDLPDLFVATSSFRSAGGAPVSAPRCATALLTAGPLIHDLIIESLNDPTLCVPGGQVDFAPVSGASAVIGVPKEALTLIGDHPLAAQLRAGTPMANGLQGLRLTL